MKILFSTIALLLHLVAFTQSEPISGIYTRTLGPSNGIEIMYKLSLNNDGSFTFHSNTKQKGAPADKNLYGKGTWKIEKKVVTFITNEKTDISEDYTLDFNGSKARFISKSPRDKSNRIVETALQFYESNIFWIKTLRLPKM